MSSLLLRLSLAIVPNVLIVLLAWTGRPLVAALGLAVEFFVLRWTTKRALIAERASHNRNR